MKPEKRLQTILQKYESYENFDLKQLDVYKKLKCANTSCLSINKNIYYILSVGIIIFLINQMDIFNHQSKCLIPMPVESSKFFREPESCDICKDVKSVEKVENVVPEKFYEEFVQSFRPVIVIDGAKNWSALDVFTFDFFKELYTNTNRKYNEKYCQFFPYKTEFYSLEEALNMDIKRAHLEPGEKPWYIGWSNCDNEAGQILKKYYNTPYFLPNTSEDIALNWIFMGGPGHGAHLHVDDVQYPSWQAQLKGRKLWRFAPPPECYFQCTEMEIVVEPGEIIVVDTNRWYHQTFILPGDISITIGSEFD